MKRISTVAGVVDTGDGGRKGSIRGGLAAKAPAMPVPADALT